MATFYYGQQAASTIYFGKTLIYQYEKKPIEFVDVYVDLPAYLDTTSTPFISVQHTDGTVYSLEDSAADIEGTEQLYYAVLPANSTYTFVPGQRFGNMEEPYFSEELTGSFSVQEEEIIITPNTIQYTDVYVNVEQDENAKNIEIQANNILINEQNSYTECTHQNSNVNLVFTQPESLAHYEHTITITWKNQTETLYLGGEADTTVQYTCENVVVEGEGSEGRIDISITSDEIIYSDVKLIIIPQTTLGNDEIYIVSDTGYTTYTAIKNGNQYEVTVPASGNYYYSNYSEEGWSLIGYYPQNTLSGYSYDLDGDINYNIHQPEAYNYPDITLEPQYGTLIINESGATDMINLGDPCSGGGQEFYSTDYIPLNEELYFEIETEQLDNTYDYSITINGITNYIDFSEATNFIPIPVSKDDYEEDDGFYTLNIEINTSIRTEPEPEYIIEYGIAVRPDEIVHVTRSDQSEGETTLYNYLIDLGGGGNLSIDSTNYGSAWYYLDNENYILLGYTPDGPINTVADFSISDERIDYDTYYGVNLAYQVNGSAGIMDFDVYFTNANDNDTLVRNLYILE